ncbi:unnamed protein product [Meloidogyne enterolobii]|uniref:Uncharacterized protein n=1 Tax=Meloidogyne enterolobii TaxID=390850 RepID=A0ACB0Y8G0_MELEN
MSLTLIILFLLLLQLQPCYFRIETQHEQLLEAKNHNQPPNKISQENKHLFGKEEKALIPHEKPKPNENLKNSDNKIKSEIKVKDAGENNPQPKLHKIFLECAIKERIKPGQKASVLQTVHSYARMKYINNALFFGLSDDVFIGSKSLISKCAEDKDANIKIYAKHIVETRCKLKDEGVTEFKVTEDFKLNLKKNSEGKCVRSHLVNHKTAHHFEQ